MQSVHHDPERSDRKDTSLKETTENRSAYEHDKQGKGGSNWEKAGKHLETPGGVKNKDLHTSTKNPRDAKWNAAADTNISPDNWNYNALEDSKVNETEVVELRRVEENSWFSRDEIDPRAMIEVIDELEHEQSKHQENSAKNPIKIERWLDWEVQCTDMIEKRREST